MNIDWTQFRRRIGITASKKAICEKWSTQVELESWFLSEALFYRKGKTLMSNDLIQAGDTYKWMWHGSDVESEGEILEIVENQIVRFSFLGCKVNVTLVEEDGEIIVDLNQREIGEDEESKMGYYVECTRGWTFYLTNLKSILEGGIDLRNKNNHLKNVINT